MENSWKLWVDDQAYDELARRQAPEGYRVAINAVDAIGLVERFGPPDFMDLDCDLADGKDVMYFLKWLERNHHDSPPRYNVHSANIIETENVKSFMNSWHKVVALGD